jgi:hypothetical protein
VSLSLIFEAEHYYELRSNELHFSGKDVENSGEFKLSRGSIVLCTQIISARKGEKGRGRYARLLVRRGENDIVLFHRLSRYSRGAGQWREVNPMVVVATADQLPTI